MTTPIVGDGTTESRWQDWLERTGFPRLEASAVAGRRVVVLAAHPDDEVLGVGGLLAALSRIGRQPVLVWATDGEASHPASTVIDATTMRARRRAEAAAAIARLGVQPVAVHHLGLPDGGLAAAGARLDRALTGIVCPNDLVLAPWAGDGHPDHEAVGEAALRLPDIDVWEYPIWMWHWAEPGDSRVPWDRCREIAVSDVATKRRAIAEFTTQIRPLGDGPEDAAILPPKILARFLRPVEVVFS